MLAVNHSSSIDPALPTSAGARGSARVVFSASEPFFRAAEKELLASFPGRASVERLGPEVGCLEAESVDLEEVAAACRERPVVFVRYLMRELARIDLTGDSEHHVERVCDVASRLANKCFDGELALQVWATGQSPIRAEGLRAAVADRLAGDGFSVARAGVKHILAICVTPGGIVVGVTDRSHCLTDWPGGRVRLAKDDGQVSRAEFKLEELLQVFDLPLPAGEIVCDLGASPGGWTRILRRHGLTVWAVDPADLDPRLAADPEIHHAATTAGRFFADTDLMFDLIVSDMRMDPVRACELIAGAASRLEPGGLAVMTLKVSPREPLRTVRTSLGILGRAYEVVFVRQLHHNRNEVTVVARRLGSPPAAPARRGKRRAAAR